MGCLGRFDNVTNVVLREIVSPTNRYSCFFYSSIPLRHRGYNVSLPETLASVPIKDATAAAESAEGIIRQRV